MVIVKFDDSACYGKLVIVTTQITRMQPEYSMKKHIYLVSSSAPIIRTDWPNHGPTNQPTNRPTNQSTDRQEREKLRFSNNRLLGLYTECAARNLLKAFPLKVCVYFDWCDAE